MILPFWSNYDTRTIAPSFYKPAILHDRALAFAQNIRLGCTRYVFLFPKR